MSLFEATRELLLASSLVVSFAAYFWSSGLMARNVNRVLPDEVLPFASIVGKRRLFQLLRLHKQLFPKSSLPSITAVSFLGIVLSAFALFSAL
jgi:hypothetical protein